MKTAVLLGNNFLAPLATMALSSAKEGAIQRKMHEGRALRTGNE